MVSANVQFDHHDHAPTLAWLQRADADLLVLVELSPSWIQSLKPVLDRYSSRVEAAHTDAYGMAIYSKRLPLRDLHLQQQPTALAVRVGTGTGAFTLFAVHTPPPVGGRAAQARDAQLNAIATAAKAAAPHFVIAGDFNATSWSPVFRNAFGGGAFNDSRAGFGVQASWPASWPAPLRIPIDHVLVGSGVSVLRRELGPDVGSDHRPVLTEIGLSEN
jgi:endonuclease/exonuclease/phosphatase (EEP) superfamily protein YafD